MDFGRNAAALRAIDGISLTINTGESVCLVGESGCGKTVTALSIAKLVPTPPANYVGGEILLNGRDVLKMSRDGITADSGWCGGLHFPGTRRGAQPGISRR